MDQRNLIPGWACTAGSLSRVSPYCTGSAGSASDGKSATTSTKPSSASPAPSSAGDVSTTSQTVRSSKGRSATMQKSHIWRPAIFIRLQAEAEQSGGSARAYLTDLSPHQRPSHPGRPRHDSEPGLHIYPGHRVPGTCASAASRAFRSLTSGRLDAGQVVRRAGVVAHGQRPRSGSMLPSPMARMSFPGSRQRERPHSGQGRLGTLLAFCPARASVHVGMIKVNFKWV